MITTKDVSKLSLDDMESLVGWCQCQNGNLWEGMTIQDILNVYHVSAEWITWEGWAAEEGDAARKAWNRVVKDKRHHLREYEPDEWDNHCQ